MKEKLKNLAERIVANRAMITTEEATKHAFVMPFLQLLGYDIFDPQEVMPEFTSDVGTKKGEKVDYAIFKNGDPAILIECKSCNSELSLDNEGQLLRYYHVSKAQFGILTNGVVYKFYTDLEAPNKMDLKPFLEIDLLDYDHVNIPELLKFSKAQFDADNVRKTADLLKCANAARAVIASELESPSDDFIKMIYSKMDCCGNRYTDKTREKITPVVKNALESIIADRVHADLTSALDSAKNKNQDIAAKFSPLTALDGIVTSQEEHDAFNIVRAIGCEVCDPDEIAMRDAKTYCAILYSDNNRKPVCRFYFNNTSQLQVEFFDNAASEKIALPRVSDLYKYRNRIISTIKKYKES